MTWLLNKILKKGSLSVSMKCDYIHVSVELENRVHIG